MDTLLKQYLIDFSGLTSEEISSFKKEELTEKQKSHFAQWVKEHHDRTSHNTN